MKKISSLSQLSDQSIKSLNIISQEEQKKLQGGLLLYCEEKRRTVLGVTYTSRQWKVAANGSLFVTVKM